MATTPDQRIAKEQLRHLRGRKQGLQAEKQLLQAATVRIQEINAEIDVINVQIDIIKARDPDDGLPVVVPLQTGNGKPKV
jgi:hypothetical protein